MNEGYSNLLVVQAEAGFLGSLTGDAFAIPGRITYSYTPRMEGGVASVGIARTPNGDSYAARWFEGTLSLEYSHNEAMALILASLINRTGTTPNYTFKGSYGSSRQSLAISLHYRPNDLYVVLRGVVIEAVRMSVRWPEIIRCSFDFKAAKILTDAPIVATAAPTHAAIPGSIGAIRYDGVDRGTAYEGSLQISNRIEFTNFGEDKIATSFQPSGGLQVDPEFAEWMESSAAGGEVAEDVRNMAEVSSRLQFEPAAGKLFRVEVPRTIFRSGTPVGLQWGGIGYRAGGESQAGNSAATWPVITMTL